MFVVLGHGDSEGECFIEKDTSVHRYAAVIDRRLTGELQLILYHELGRGPDSLLRVFPAPVVENWNPEDPGRMIDNTFFAPLDAAELAGLVSMRDQPPAAAAGVHVVGWADSAVVQDMALCTAPATCVPPHHTCDGVFARLAGEPELHLLTCDATEDDESFDGDSESREVDEGQWLLPWETPQDFEDGTDIGSMLQSWVDVYKYADHETWKRINDSKASAESQRFHALLMEQKEFAVWSYRHALTDFMERSGTVSARALFMWSSDSRACVEALWDIENFPENFVRGALAALQQKGGRQIVGDRLEGLVGEIRDYCTRHSADLGYAVADRFCRVKSAAWVYDWSKDPRNARYVDAIGPDCPDVVTKVQAELIRRGDSPDTLSPDLRRVLAAQW